MIWLAVAIGGAVGALTRHGLVVWTESIWTVAAINIVGSFLLGMLVQMGGGLPDEIRTGLGAGLLGGFTTFSTFSVQTVIQADSGEVGAAVVYVLVSVLGSLAAGAAGYLLARNFAT